DQTTGEVERVVTAVFTAAEAKPETAPAVEALRSLWAQDKWDSEAILTAISAAGAAAEKDADAAE
ncbi:MAG TPA: hypothetical protein VG518_05350, partial [Solirubrobacterales bacterium]|nr:hypothetical protein [Solirubrobacterales bacterium]